MTTPVRLAAILDTETGGLDPAKHPCVEVAVTVYDLELAVPLASFSSLIQSESNEAQEINRIPVDLLRSTLAPPAEVVWRRVEAIIQDCDVFIAHRAEFDRSFTPEPIRSSRPWVCSKLAIEWPMGKYGDGLVHLALSHGVGVVNAHRAATDVDILCRLLSRTHEILTNWTQARDGVRPLQFMIERAMRPRRKLQALVSYEDREIAKAAGFQWEPAPAKRWVREAFFDQLFPFPTKEV